MPNGYWVGRVDVIKPEGYQAYGVALAEVLRKYGAKFLVRGGTRLLPLARIRRSEGAARGRRGHRHHRDRRLRRATADGLIASRGAHQGTGPTSALRSNTATGRRRKIAAASKHRSR
jgi:hypothetical protein